MKTSQSISDTTSQTYLAGTILFANIDYASFGGYALKAAIGGFIWMAFKLAGDYLSDKLLSKRKTKQANVQDDEPPTRAENEKE